VEVASATAVWYSTGLPAVPIRWVLLVRDPQGEFATQALLCTDLGAKPEQILRCFVLRWQMETTFQEARRHLGVETQKAVVGAGDPEDHTGAVGLVLAHHPVRPPANGVQERGGDGTAALVRKELWAHATFRESRWEPDTVKVPRAFVEHLTETLCYAA
jgi:hypothetical protein